MIKIKPEGFDTVKRILDGQQKQVAYATSRALNNLAFQAMREGQAHISSNLDKPTAWTVKAWYVRRKAAKDAAAAAKLNARDAASGVNTGRYVSQTAVVGWSDYLANKRGHAAEYYLSQQWHGGNRAHKAFESRLIQAGILPAGHYVVPGKAAEELGMVNAYGNIKGSVYSKIASKLGTFTESGYNTQNTASGKRNPRNANAVYWAGKPGKNTPAGIWLLDENYRNGRGRLRPVLIFVDNVRYRAKLDLEKIERKVGANMQREFEKELAAALRAAR